MGDLPLGQREGPRLEFKRAAALGRPDELARVVVAFLNASGGELWIGIAEEDETATGLDPVREPEKAARALHDHLVDAIEPSPSGGEIQVEPVGTPGAGGVLRVVAIPRAERKPYAVLRRSARQYLLRVGARIRPMAREELRDRFRATQAPDDAVRRAREKLLEARAGAGPGLWCMILPVELRPALDLGDETYARLLMDPRASENRETGWTFANPYQRPSRASGRLVQETPALKRASLYEEGASLLEVAKKGLAWREESLYPLALIEYPTSLFRLAAAVHRHAGGRCRAVLGDLALIDTAGLALRPGSPLQELFTFGDARVFEEGDEIVLSPLEFSFEEILERPDRCSARLWGRIYHAFGFAPDAWPPEYDRERGRLLVGS